MDHVKALAIKGVMTLLFLYVVLTLGFGVSFLNVLIVTIVLGAVSYLLGDLYLLIKTTNSVAATADVGLTFIIVWLLGMALTGLGTGTMAGAAAISAVIIALGEYFFHIYVVYKRLAVKKRLKAYMY
ncbi:DUF2512 family protein [Halobacillus naozhouensis]|uniref:DUF2512 family protein n=1 Tax=Halobacillus naozhouensis TaxID=554880 RepID=A0ABY8IZL2_9BACI|nr:DUF2512 family protein [Halobacillus naozhouensis]WFT75689.1 DUF2512 family protein [Halobacillus naozhouensis]